MDEHSNEWISWRWHLWHKCIQNVLHLLSLRAYRTISLWPPSWFIHHDALPWAHHALLTWSLCTTSLLSQKFKIASIWTILISKWCFSPFFTLAIPWHNVEQMGLTHLPPLSSIQNLFQPKIWPLMPKSWSKVFPLVIITFYLM
jgi:hypothetical protein